MKKINKLPKVGVIFAGDQELAPFLPLLENSTIESKAMLKFYCGNIKGLEVVTSILWSMQD